MVWGGSAPGAYGEFWEADFDQVVQCVAEEYLRGAGLPHVATAQLLEGHTERQRCLTVSACVYVCVCVVTYFVADQPFLAELLLAPSDEEIDCGHVDAGELCNATGDHQPEGNVAIQIPAHRQTDRQAWIELDAHTRHTRPSCVSVGWAANL